jgi:hypothetical protein
MVKWWFGTGAVVIRGCGWVGEGQRLEERIAALEGADHPPE